MKNGDLIRINESKPDSGEEFFFTSNLIVHIVDETSFGDYQCVAENEAGAAKRSVVLKKSGEK